jgi:dUTP pyrophosphatase
MLLLLFQRKYKMAEQVEMAVVNVPQFPTVTMTMQTRKNGYEGVSFAYKKTRARAKTPKRGNTMRVGWTCFSSEDVMIKQGERGVVPLGFLIEKFPKKTYARFVIRHELSVTHGLEVGSGIVEADFHEELKAVIFNHGKQDFEIKRGTKVCQIIFERVYRLPTFGLDASPPPRQPEFDAPERLGSDDGLGLENEEGLSFIQGKTILKMII